MGALRSAIQKTGALYTQRGSGPLYGKGMAVKGASSKGLQLNKSKSTPRAGKVFREFEKNGSRYHVYLVGGKRMVFKVGKAKAASNGGTAAP